MLYLTVSVRVTSSCRLHIASLYEKFSCMCGWHFDIITVYMVQLRQQMSLDTDQVLSAVNQLCREELSSSSSTASQLLTDLSHTQQ